jgi:lipopolysaccharide export system permease protein
MTYYAILSLGKALGDKGVLPPIPALWLPNLIVGGVAAYFFRKAIHETPLAIQTWLDVAIELLSQRLAKYNRTRKD